MIMLESYQIPQRTEVIILAYWKIKLKVGVQSRIGGWWL